MENFEENLPSPLGTIDELLVEEDISPIKRSVYVGCNLGPRTFLLFVPMKEFYDYSEVANERGDNGEPIAQRKLNLPHAKKLAQYILKAMVSAVIQDKRDRSKPIPPEYLDIQHELGEQPYFSLQPIVCNIRSIPYGAKSIHARRQIDKETNSTVGYEVSLNQKDIFWVIDGQHRRKGMQLYFDFLETVTSDRQYQKKSDIYFPVDGHKDLNNAELLLWQDCIELSRSMCKVAVEVHLGLNTTRERQLFHDLNNLAKGVEVSLALDFDESNPVNNWVKHTLEPMLAYKIIDRDVSDWQKDEGGITRKDLVSINARLILNKTNAKGATPSEMDAKKAVADKFWRAVKAIPHLGSHGAKLKTIAAQPIVLKALAKLAYDFSFGKSTKSDTNFKILIDNIPQLDFSHQNPMWRYYQMTETERRDNGIEALKAYLPTDEEGANRDIGGYDPNAKLFRFGAKHNDIFPIVGDMIRWKLNLPNRNKQ